MRKRKGTFLDLLNDLFKEREKKELSFNSIRRRRKRE